MSAVRSKARSRPRPSILDVARTAGVSPGCVSNVMNGRRRQDDPIGRAVLEAVEKLGYRRNTIASNLRRQHSRIIGLVIPDFENPFFAELVAQLERFAEETQYRIVATSSREDPKIEAREVDELIGWRVAGVLLVPSQATSPEDLLEGNETPFVLMDRIAPLEGFDCIGVNNAEASAEVMRRLIDLGHRRVLVVHLGKDVGNVRERLEGVKRAVSESGVRVEVNFLPTGGTVESARDKIDRYLEDHPDPTAIFSLFNPATLAAYGITQARDLDPGRKTALVGFDDSAWMAQVHPPVAAIVQPVREIAKNAWERLLARIEGGDGPGGIMRVGCRLEPRGTLVAAQGKGTQ